MGEVLPLFVFAAGLAACMYGMSRFARLARRRGIGSGLMGIIDEQFHPAGLDQQIEHRIEEERMVPRESREDV
jgi:hypothetical protein